MQFVTMIGFMAMTTAAPPAPASPTAARLICVADPRTGAVERVLSRRRGDGSFWTAGRVPRPLNLDERPQASRADWYKNGLPIEWKGRSFEPAAREWQVTALGRYLRGQGLYRGVPLFSIWPGRDRSLAVLVDQESCTFRAYHPVEEAPR